jgi:D-3-phosphoglycerate dehydrogenase
VVEEQVTYVNAPLLASERGITVALERDPQSPDYRNLVTVRGVMADGTAHSVSGTLMGTRQVERITEIDGYEVDLRPSAHLLFLRYEDRPGVVGNVGALLGEAGVNIASAQVSRGESAGSEALMSLSLDSPVPPDVARHIGDTIGARVSRWVDLVSS